MRILLTALIFTITTTIMAQENKGHYADINGFKLYYEIHGSGSPLVLLHGGGSTIESNYGRVLPQLAQTHKVIAIELQAHGHTPDRDKPLSFEQDAEDVAALLKKLSIAKADIMGFSNGGTTAIQIGIRHPEIVNKLILASAIYSREGMFPGFFDYMKNAKFEDMPQPLKDAYLKANPGNTKGLLTMFNRDVERMNNFKNISEVDVKSITAPTLIINGDKDVVQNAHALKLSQLLPNARLMIVPSGHGDYIGEICMPDKESKMPEAVVAMIEDFLK
ncbi:alpha/beta hydrolase [Flavobacterium album]|uniref:Alpha/beta hydrolase n=1 Tax=Flavobacterium album TaxID=2175091 RepID=A0A2S1QUH3_9FLAO|nr:alpha/beta hydrolase [Flavobacterium album]AWH83901.1 alpha/beta hydrolase [Flavobacterium album]